jgi:uncharacterized protein (DUF4415 family)
MAETKVQRQHLSYSEEVHARLNADFKSISIPEEWHEIWRERDRRDEKQVRVTLRLDAEVVRFFRSMGKGYQPRMNRVLRAFMHDRLAGLVAGPEDRIDQKDLEKLHDVVKALEGG